MAQPLGTGHKSDPPLIAIHGFVVSHQSQGKLGKICVILVELCSINGTNPQLGDRMLMDRAMGTHNLQRGISTGQLKPLELLNVDRSKNKIIFHLHHSF